MGRHDFLGSADSDNAVALDGHGAVFDDAAVGVDSDDDAVLDDDISHDYSYE
ncbi:hypothetical protein D3C87_2197430 [compost metagenome]